MSELFRELRPFQINAAEAGALLDVIQPRLQVLVKQNTVEGAPITDWNHWNLKDLEEYILLRDTLEKLHKVTQEAGGE